MTHRHEAGGLLITLDDSCAQTLRENVTAVDKRFLERNQNERVNILIYSTVGKCYDIAYLDKDVQSLE